MIFIIHSDASYIYFYKSQSHSGGIHFLGEPTINPQYADILLQKINGIIYATCKILKNIMASSAEAEMGSLFLNCQ